MSYLDWSGMGGNYKGLYFRFLVMSKCTASLGCSMKLASSDRKRLPFQCIPRKFKEEGKNLTYKRQSPCIGSTIPTGNQPHGNGQIHTDDFPSDELSCLGDFLASHDYQRVNPFWGCFSHSIKMKMIHVSKV